MARIMIVDDTPLMRTLINAIVTEHGHEVVGMAANGKEAVSRYPEARPDLVIMDVSMPEMDGLQALTKLLEIDPQAKVVMCSTFAQQRFVIEAIELGAKDFVVKPFSALRVTEAIDHVLNR
ncbi:response regulator [Paenibacillus athensensis]|uniref:Two-component system response regulator n=1 Tax=Paenibacillus athensensis TaxID=1967502 RepID=A0A4Y8Q9A7_9BACL|nr:response regulator [Paenibacillus athensensis]MCD1258990.1 response regulator [Paenibacillus athensensis]